MLCLIISLLSFVPSVKYCLKKIKMKMLRLAENQYFLNYTLIILSINLNKIWILGLLGRATTDWKRLMACKLILNGWYYLNFHLSKIWIWSKNSPTNVVHQPTYFKRLYFILNQISIIKLFIAQKQHKLSIKHLCHYGMMPD
jgi:hypothetical protein